MSGEPRQVCECYVRIRVDASNPHDAQIEITEPLFEVVRDWPGVLAVELQGIVPTIVFDA